MRYLEETGKQETEEELFEPEEIEEPETEEVSDQELEKAVEEERVSFINRLPKIKAYRNKKMFRRLILLLMLFLVPLLATIYYISPLSRLSAITVKGNQKVSAELIIEGSELQVHEEIWKQYFDREVAIDKIQTASPRIKNANITISQFNQLQIDVQEFEEIAVLVRGQEYLPILENGSILEEPQSDAGQDKLIFEGFSDEEKILQTLNAYQTLEKEIQEGISQVKYAPDSNNDQLLNLYMNDGNQVIVNISNMASQMRYYPQVAREMDDKGIIDMEVGIFAYPYPDSEATEEESNETDLNF